MTNTNPQNRPSIAEKADFESGFAKNAAGVAESVGLAVDAGVAGLSIEDSTGDAAQPLFALDDAVERMRAARQAIDRKGGDTLLVGSASKLTVSEYEELGVRRISVGGAMARSAWGGFMSTAHLLSREGRFDGFAQAASGKELNSLFAS
jgi:2-methylisocitrate lyase-like PEP mutase family enzyme